MSRRDEGSVYKRDDRWFARLRYTDADGRSREKKRTCISQAAAKAAIKEIRVEIANDLIDRKTYTHLDAFFRREYVHTARIVGGKKISGFRQKIVVIEHYLNAALACFGGMFLDSITYADIQKYKTSIANRQTIHGRPRSAADINHHLKCVRRLFNIAIEQGWLDVSPFKRGGPLIIESFASERTRVITTAEESRLLAACDNKYRRHLRPLLVFAIETACRRGEIKLLKWSDVDLSGRVIKIRAANTKTMRTRLVPVSARLRETLAMLRQNHLKPHSPVFGVSDFKRSFATACRDAGLTDLHFHDLRHTAITRMLEKGISPPLVMKISGHEQQKTFMRYVNQTESSILDIARRLDAAA